MCSVQKDSKQSEGGFTELNNYKQNIKTKKPLNDLEAVRAIDWFRCDSAWLSIELKI